MTFVPPVGAVPASGALTGATPVAADLPAQDKNIQAVFDGVNYADLQGELISGAEFLGPVGSTVLRDFLDRAKKAAVNSNESKRHETKTGGIEVLTPGGPASSPLQQTDSHGADSHGPASLPLQQTDSHGVASNEGNRHSIEAEKVLEAQLFLTEFIAIGSLTSAVTKDINSLIKGQ